MLWRQAERRMEITGFSAWTIENKKEKFWFLSEANWYIFVNKKIFSNETSPPTILLLYHSWGWANDCVQSSIIIKSVVRRIKSIDVRVNMISPDRRRETRICENHRDARTNSIDQLKCRISIYFDSILCRKLSMGSEKNAIQNRKPVHLSPKCQSLLSSKIRCIFIAFSWNNWLEWNASSIDRNIEAPRNVNSFK